MALYDPDEYPEGHSPFCYRDCDHPCHDAYDAAKTSKAPDRCHYCEGDDPNCGFCDNGKPLDTQDDWDRSWGKVLDLGESSS